MNVNVVLIATVLGASLTIAVGAARAQTQQIGGLDAGSGVGELEDLPAEAQAGRTAETGAGAVGQRQTDDQIAPNSQPLGRISTRVENRVQSRIQNRIDRDYDPLADAISPFEVANEQTRRPGRRIAPR